MTHSKLAVTRWVAGVLIATVIGASASMTLATSLKQTFESVFATAVEAFEVVASVNYEWRDTGLLLEKSRQAADSGEFATAISLAKQAEQQAKSAHQQMLTNTEFLKRVPFYNPSATPEQDVEKLQTFFFQKFPNLPKEEFANGFYALDAVMRENWQAIEEFPPYGPAIDAGEQAWNEKFSNGKSYQNCFGRPDVADQYPRWDKQSGQVVTLSVAINSCREQQGESVLEYDSDELLAVEAYIAYQSRGKPTQVVVPEDDPGALAAYNHGKEFYFSRRGQLNLACYQCHFEQSGQKIRANVLSTAVGQTTHWPAYRSEWGSMGSLHRRYMSCNDLLRAKQFDYQSEEYRNLEYFHAHMSNGIPLNGPGARF